MSGLRSSPRRRRQLGLSLVEVLVGVGIGVIGALAIFQTAAIWNRHMQTTSAGGDAQVAGALALFNIERDFKQAGHGFGQAPAPVMGCLVQATDVTRSPPAFSFPLRPIDIGVGPAGSPDTLNVLYGNSSFFVEGQDFLSSTPTSKTLRRRGGFRLGDLVVVADAGAGPGTANCRLAEITSDTNPDLLTVDHANTSYTPFYGGGAKPSRFNPAAGLDFAYVGGQLFNLGPQPQLISWRVGTGGSTLQRGEELFNVAADPVADGVVNLKAEYGFDADDNTRIDPSEWHDTLPATSDWKRVLAIRVALLVRSRQFERSGDSSASAPAAVTAAAPTYFGTPTSAPSICTVTPCPFTMTNLDGSPGGTDVVGSPNNWRYYRYRVYERVIPLKNMLWAVP